MAKKHSEITNNNELHVPKGFTEASNTTALIKNESGVLEYRDLGLLGATGPAGPAGTTLESVAVADILDPSSELASKGGVAGDTLVVRQVAGSEADLPSIYLFDSSGESPTNIPFTVDGSGGQWVLIAGKPLNNMTGGASSTGLITGGQLSINTDPTKFDVAAGSGWIIDNYTTPENPKSVYVKWSSSSANLVTNIATDNITYISIDVTGNIIQRVGGFSQALKRQEILLGAVVHPSNIIISSVANRPILTYGIGLSTDDIANAIGPSINLSGNVITAGGNNLRISKSAGVTFALGSNYNTDTSNPNITTDSTQSLASFRKLYRDGSGDYVVIPSVTDIDPNFYDNGSGTLAPMPSGEFQIQRIYFSNIDDSINVNYGQATYKTMAEAAANIFAEQPQLTNSMKDISLRAFLIVKEGTTNLQTSTNAKFIEAGAMGDKLFPKNALDTTTAQQAYNNSSANLPQVETDSVRDGYTIKEGSGVGGSVFEVLKSDSSPLMRLTADGNSVINSHNDLHINGYNSKQLAFNASTGVINGGTLSVGTPNTTFSISDGSGLIVDPTSDPANPTVTEVSWTGKTNIAVTNIATNLITFVSIDINGNVVQQTSRWSAADTRNKIILGVVVHVDKTIVDTVNNEHHTILDVGGQLGDIIEGIGFVNLDGNVYSANGANLSLDKSSGVMMGRGINFFNDPNNPHKLNLAGLTALTFQYRFSNGDNGVTGTVVDPDNIDNKAGGLTALANNQWSVQRIYSFTSNNVKIQRGQAAYSSKENAISGIATENYTTEPSIAANGMLRGFIVVKKGATNLSDSNQAVFISASKFQTVGGASTGTASTLQSAYDNSGDPEITVTDVATKAVTFKDSSTNATRDNIIEVKNTSDALVLGVSRNELKVNMQAYSSTNTLSDATTIATDCNNGNVHTVTLTDNRTLGAPTNLKDGATYIWIIKQDATGSRTLAYNAVFKFPGGDIPVLSTAANSVDILTGVSDGTNIYCSLAADFQ